MTEAGDGKTLSPLPREPRRYEMKPPKHGIFLIINNKNFEAKTGLSIREGTDVDAEALYNLFTAIGYQVTRKDGLKAIDMLREVEKAASMDHSNYDSFGLAVLSHGADQGLLYGTDGIIEITNLVAPIKACKTLAGKPKLCFFQACRGKMFDDGREVEDDASNGPQKVARIPMEADFLYHYSTTPGYYSWRNPQEGSWFIQALCSELGALWNTDTELCRILTRVNYEVAYSYESRTKDAKKNAKKEMPSIVSMLTKDLYFTK